VTLVIGSFVDLGSGPSSATGPKQW